MPISIYPPSIIFIHTSSPIMHAHKSVCPVTSKIVHFGVTGHTLNFIYLQVSVTLVDICYHMQVF